MPWRRMSGGTAHGFLASALDRAEWSVSSSGRFTPGERAHGTHLDKIYGY